MKKTLKNIAIVLGAILIIGTIYLYFRTDYHEDKDRNYITADDGRIMILHGMNILSDGKGEEFRVGHADKELIQRLSKDWGYNSVRLLLFWDGIEPEKGKFNYEYLARVKERLDWCQEAGLKVILDMHQDLYAVDYGGDGAPKWAIIHEGQPYEPQTPWELNYLEPAVQTAITNFWDTDRGHGYLQEHFINSMLEALKYLGNHPSVIGIDLYNEPTMATWDGYNNHEEKYLTPFYQKIINKIREINNDIWIFYEPSALTVNQGAKSYLGLLKDTRIGEQRLAYFPHIYTLDLDITQSYIGNPFFLNLWSSARQDEYKRQKAPLLIGEFGLGGNDENSLEFVEEVMILSDKITGGWFYWDYNPGAWSILDKDKNEVAKSKVLDRPYPRLIAGEKPEYSYNRTANIFSFKVEWNDDIAKKLKSNITEIYIPNHTWPKGWKINKIEGDVKWNFNKETRLLHIQAITKGIIHIEIHEIATK